MGVSCGLCCAWHFAPGAGLDVAVCPSVLRRDTSRADRERRANNGLGCRHALLAL